MAKLFSGRAKRVERTGWEGGREGEREGEKEGR